MPIVSRDVVTKGARMPDVEINKTAPDFQLPDFKGENVRLSDFVGRKHVLLVFNRGFV